MSPFLADLLENAITPAVQRTAKLYGWVGWQALRLAVKAWPVALVVVAYALLMGFAATLIAPLGMIGGFLLGLLEALCISSYLYLLCLLYTSPSPRDRQKSRMPSSA